jgi:hypothetical protein
MDQNPHMYNFLKLRQTKEENINDRIQYFHFTNCLLLFICSLFNDAVSNTDYTISNDWRNLNLYGSMIPCLNFKLRIQKFLDGLRKATKYLRQDKLCPKRDLYRALSEYDECHCLR